ncbi:MAG: mlrA [Gammaproteobacteria bacterium]|nr:mlrA [Gammaproteobacteria bacterium]
MQGKEQKRRAMTLIQPKNSQTPLPPIPDKRYFTISEVGGLCDLKPHVLRYWEQEFSQLSPVKRRGNRRYYQKKDILIVRQIRQLLYNDGFTIEGARAKLSNASLLNAVKETQPVEMNVVVKKLITDLETILEELK